MSDIDWESINEAVDFSDCVNNTTVQAKIVSVYDGDTVKAIFPLNGVMYRWNCRLGGVDTPELRTKSQIEKDHGYHVRDKLRDIILNKVVSLKCGDLDKYGRLLVTIVCEIEGETCTVNDWLIKNDYAFAYDGGTKRSWDTYLRQKKTPNAKKSFMGLVFGS